MTDEGWTTMRFDEFAERVNETVMPAESDLDRYIGLEHLDTMDLTIRRWDEGRNLVGQKLVVRKGDIIIARRNWYLRRVAIAPFDALCSAHAMIVRPKKDAINPDFFPYFLLSEQFFQRALAISVGSLSPTINWSTLRKQDFKLPSEHRQSHFVKIIQPLQDNKIALTNSLTICKRIFDNSLKKMSKELFDNYRCVKLEEIADVSRGMFSHRPRNLPEFYGGGIPYVQTGDVENSDRYIEHYNYTLTKAGVAYSKSFPENTIFITIAANIGSTAISKEEVYATDSVVGVQPKCEIMVEFLELILRSYKWHLEFEVATQTAQKNINLQNLRPLLIPVIPISEQVKFCDFFLGFWGFSRRILSAKNNLNSVMRQLINSFTTEVMA